MSANSLTQLASGLSPRRTAQHESRVQRSHRFQSRYNSLILQVIRGSEFLHPVKNSFISKAEIQISLGNSSFPPCAGIPANSDQSLWSFQWNCQLPYHGEPRLRFLLMDVGASPHIQIGFHDLNLTGDWLKDGTAETQIPLMGRYGCMGKLQIRYSPSEESIRTPLMLTKPEPPPVEIYDLSTPLSQASSQYGSVALTVNEVESPHKQRVIIEALYGKNSLRTDVASGPHVFYFPNENLRYIKVTGADELKGATTFIDLDPYVGKGPQTVPVQLKEAPALLRCVVDFRQQPQSRAHVQGLMEPSPSDIEAHSLSSDSEAGDGDDAASVSSAGLNMIRTTKPITAKTLRLTVHTVKFSDDSKLVGRDVIIGLRLGQVHLHTKPFKAPTDQVMLGKAFVFPYQGHRSVKFTLLDTSLSELASGKLDMDPYVNSRNDLRQHLVDVRVNCPKNKKKLIAILKFMLDPITNAVTSPLVEEYSLMVERDKTFNAVPVNALVKKPKWAAFSIKPVTATGFDKPRKITVEPYIVTSYDNYELQGPVVNEKDGVAHFNSSHSYPVGTSGVCRIAIFDRSRLLKDQLCGYAYIDLNEHLDSSHQTTVTLPLFNKKHEPEGQLNCMLTPLQEAVSRPEVYSEVLPETGSNKKQGEANGYVRIRVKRGEQFSSPLAQVDPLKPHIRIRHGQTTFSTTASTPGSGGTNPVFNGEFVMSYLADEGLHFHASEDSHFLAGRSLGHGTFNLSEVMRSLELNEEKELAVKLVQKNGKDGGILYFSVTPVASAVVQPRPASQLPSMGKQSMSNQILQLDVYKVTDLISTRAVEHHLTASDLKCYCRINYGKFKVKGKRSVDRSGTEQRFQDSFLLPNISRQPVVVTLMDDLMLQKDMVIGSGNINWYKPPGGEESLVVPLLLDNQKVGNLHCRISCREGELDCARRTIHSDRAELESESEDEEEVLEGHSGQGLACKSFQVYCLNAKGLQSPSYTAAVETFDPYCVCLYGPHKLNGQVYNESDGNPQMHDGFAFPVESARMVKIEMFDRNRIFADKSIGYGTIDMDPYFQLAAEKTPKTVPIYSNRGKQTGVLKCLISTSKDTIDRPHNFLHEQGVIDASRQQQARAALNRTISDKSDISEDIRQTPSKVQTTRKGFHLELVKITGAKNHADKDVGMNVYTRVHFGPDELRGSTIKDVNDTFNIGDVFHFPYKPLEFIHVDIYESLPHGQKVRLGRAPINLDNCANKGVARNKFKITIVSKQKAAVGILYIILTFTDAVDRAPWAELVSPYGDKNLSSFDDNSSHGLTPSMLTGVTTVPSAFRVQLLNAHGFDHLHGLKNIYVVGRLGPNALRSETIRNVKDIATFKENFLFPYQKNQKMKLTVRSVREQGVHLDLGSGKINLDNYLGTTEQIDYCVCKMSDFTGGRKGEPLTVVIGLSQMKHPQSHAIVESRGSAKADMSAIPFKSVHISEIGLLVDTKHKSFSSLSSFNPYVTCNYGQAILRTATVHNYSKWCEFPNVMSYTLKDEHIRLSFDVLHNAKMARDKIMGITHINVNELIPVGEGFGQPVTMELLDKDGKGNGRLTAKIHFDNAPVANGAALTLPATPATTVAPTSPVSQLAGSDVDSEEDFDLTVRTKSLAFQSFSVFVDEGRGLNKGKNDILQPFLKFLYGKTLLSGATKKNGGVNPDFGEEFVFPLSDARTVKIQVKDNVPRARDAVVGEALLDLESFSDVIDGVSTVIPLKDPKMRTPAGHLRVQFGVSQQSVAKAFVQSNQEARLVKLPGTKGSLYTGFRVEVINCSDLKNEGRNEILKPFVEVFHGKSKASTATNTTEGVNPRYSDELYFPYENLRDIHLEVRDNITMARDVVVGHGNLNIDPFMMGERTTDNIAVVPLELNGSKAGTVTLRIYPLKAVIQKAYTKASARLVEEAEVEDESAVLSATKTDIKSVKLQILQGLNMPSSPKNDILQPYVLVKHGPNELRSKTIEDGGSNAEFGDTMTFPYAGFRNAVFTVKDNARMRRDPVVANGVLDFDTILQKVDQPVPVSVNLKDISNRTVGTLNCLVTPSKSSVEKASVYSPPQKKATTEEEEVYDMRSSALTAAPVQSFSVELLDVENLPPGPKDRILCPFVIATSGKNTLRSRTVLNGGTNPTFGDKMFFPYDNIRFVKFMVKDNVKLARDPKVAVGEVDLDRYCTTLSPKDISVPLTKPDGSSIDKCSLKLRFVPSKSPVDKAYTVAPSVKVNASPLPVASDSEDDMVTSSRISQKVLSYKIELERAQSLPNSSKNPVLQPFVVVKAGRDRLRSLTAREGGGNARFGDQFFFPNKQIQTVHFKVKDNAKYSIDPTIGRGTLNMEKFLGDEPTTALVSVNDKNGRILGSLHVVVTPSTSVKVNKAYKISPAQAGKVSNREVPIVDDEHPEAFEPSSVQADAESFRIQIVNGRGIPKSPKNSVLQPYVIVKTGATELRTQTVEDGGPDPAFGDIMHIPYEGYRNAVFIVKDNARMRRDPVVATGIMDLDTVIKDVGRQQTLVIPLKDTSNRTVASLNCHVTSSRDILDKPSVQSPPPEKQQSHQEDFDLRPTALASVPIHSYCLELVQAEHVPSPSADRTISPFVIATCGKNKLRSQTVENGGTNATFGDKMFFPYDRIRYVHFLVKDNVRHARDPKLAIGEVDLDEYCSNATPKDIVVPLSQPNAGPIPNCCLKVRLVPSTSTIEKAYTMPPPVKVRSSALPVASDSEDDLTVSKTISPQIMSYKIELERAQGLPNSSKNPVLQPFVIVKSGRDRLRSLTAREGGGNARFGDQFFFPNQQIQNVHFKVKDNAKHSVDPTIGRGTLNMEQFSSGSGSSPVALPVKDKKGNVIGNLHLVVTPSPTAEVDKAYKISPIQQVKMITREETVTDDDDMEEAFVASTVRTEFKSFRVDILDCMNLEASKKSSDKLSPWVFAQYGSAKLKSSTQSGPHPVFADSMYFPNQNMRFVVFQVKDNLRMRRDPILGSCKLDVEKMFTNGKEQEVICDLLRDDTTSTPSQLRLRFHPSHERVDKATVVIDKQRETAMESDETHPDVAVPIVKRHQWESVEIQLKGAQNLPPSQKSTVANPWVFVQYGKDKLKSSTIVKGGQSVEFRDTMYFPNHHTRYMIFQVKDNVPRSRDPILGTAKLDLDECELTPGSAAVRNAQDITLKLHDEQTKAPAGTLRFSINPRPDKINKAYVVQKLPETTAAAHTAAAHTTAAHTSTEFTDDSYFEGHDLAADLKSPYKSFDVVLHEAQGLPPLNASSKKVTQPWIFAQYGKTKLKSNTIPDGGTNPKFNDTFHFPTQDLKYLQLDVKDNVKLKRDPVLGSTRIDVEPLLQSGEPKTLTMQLKGAEAAYLNVTIVPSDTVVEKAFMTTCSRPVVAPPPPPPPVVKPQEDLSSSRSQILLPGRSLLLELISAHDLPQVPGADVMQPWVLVQYGNDKLKSVTAVDGGKHPVFGDRCHLPNRQLKFIQLDVKHNVRAARDPVIASGRLNLDQLLAKHPSGESHEPILPLVAPDGVSPGGTLKYRLVPSPEEVEKSYIVAPPVHSLEAIDDTKAAVRLEKGLPFNSFQVQLLHAVNLSPASSSKSPSQIQPWILAQYGTDKLKSSTIKDGGSNPVFVDTLHFPNRNLRYLQLQVKDNVRMARDPALGTARIDLDPLLTTVEPKQIDLPLLDVPNAYVASVLKVRIVPSHLMVDKAFVSSKTMEQTKSIDDASLPQRVASSASEQDKRKSFQLAVVEGRRLPCNKRKHVLQPFVEAYYGKTKLKTSTIRNGGQNPTFAETFNFPFLRGTETIRLVVKDNVKMARDPILGESTVNLSQYLDKAEPVTVNLKPSGALIVTGEFSKLAIDRAFVSSREGEVTEEEDVIEEGTDTTAASTAHPKSFMVEVLDCASVQVDGLHPQVPIVQADHGGYSLKSQTGPSETGGSTFLHLSDQMVFPYLHRKPLKLSIHEKVAYGSDILVGQGVILPERLSSVEGPTEVPVILTTLKGHSAGSCVVLVTPLKEDIESPYLRVQAASVARYSVATEPTGVVASGTQSLRIGVVEVRGCGPATHIQLKHSPYKIRMPRNHSTVCMMPYEQLRYLLVNVKQARDFAKDVVVGRGAVDLDTYIRQGGLNKEQEVLVPMRTADQKDVGAIRLKLMPSDLPLAAPILETRSTAPDPKKDIQTLPKSDLPPPSPPRPVPGSSLHLDILDLLHHTTAPLHLPLVVVVHAHHSLRTKICFTDSPHPKFGDIMTFPLEKTSNIKFIVKSLSETGASEHLLGYGQLDLAGLKLNEAETFTVDLKALDGNKPMGTLNVLARLGEERLIEPQVFCPWSGPSVGPSKISQLDQNARVESEMRPPFSSFALEVINGVNLRSPNPTFDRLDLYIQARYADSQLLTDLFQKVSQSPEFNHVFNFNWKSYRFLVLKVYDKINANHGVMIGGASVDLEDCSARFPTDGNPCPIKLELRDAQNRRSGILNCRIKLHKTALISSPFNSEIRDLFRSFAIKVVDARDLVKTVDDTQTIAVIVCDKQEVPTRHGLGPSPVYNSTVILPKSGGKHVIVNVYAIISGRIRLARLVGRAVIDRLAFTEGGKERSTLTLPLMDEGGLPSGKMRLELSQSPMECSSTPFLDGPDGGDLMANWRLLRSQQPPGPRREDSGDNVSDDAGDEYDQEELQLISDRPIPEWKGVCLTLAGGKNLRSTDSARLDPYITVRLGANELRSEPFMAAGSDPKILTSFSFPYNNQATLYVSVSDFEPWREDTFLGDAYIRMANFVMHEKSTLPETSSRIEIPLEDRAGRPAGTLSGSLRLTKIVVETPTLVQLGSKRS